MRDVILAVFLFGSIPFILRRPAVGVFLWVWVSIMAPHRLTFGFAHDFAFAQLIAISTLIGMLFSGEPKRLPVTPVTLVLFVLLLWMNVTTFFALEPDLALPMWERVMKIQLMVCEDGLHRKLRCEHLPSHRRSQRDGRLELEL